MSDPRDLELGRLDATIRAFAQRTDVVPKYRFERLDEAARARAFTAARIADLDVLRDLHSGLREIIGSGGSFRDFVDDIEGTMERRGWAGTTAWHAKLIYDQNVAMAYTAGRFDQARESGATYWRYLPSTAAEPRGEHEQYYGQVFPLGEGPMPPLDFGCACEWEPVFADEMAGVDVQQPLRVSEGQEFQFSPASYFEPVSIRLADYPAELHEAIRRMAAESRYSVRVIE